MDSPPQEPKVIEVTINWIGPPCKYEIKTTASVRELKQMIKDEFIIGMPIKSQNLEFNGVWLQDEAKLEDYGINSDVNINLVKKIVLWIIKDRDEMSTYYMLVNETITVAKLKGIIAEQFGEPNITRLRDNRNDIQLEDHLTLSHYGMGDDSDHVEWYDKLVSQYDIPVETTIMELKKMIEKDHAIGMAAEMQELHFNGKSLDQDQLKLEDYNVPSHGATITVFTKFQLSVRKDGVSHPFAVHNGMTVGDLEKIVAQHFGKLTAQIVLDLQGEILLDDVVLTAVKFDGSELYVSFAK